MGNGPAVVPNYGDITEEMVLFIMHSMLVGFQILSL